MGDVVSIDIGKFLRYYIPRSTFQTILEETLFVLGVLGTIVAPQVVYCAAGGPVSAWVFVVCAEAGVIVGLVKYIHPETITPIVEPQKVAAPRDETPKHKKAA